MPVTHEHGEYNQEATGKNKCVPWIQKEAHAESNSCFAAGGKTSLSFFRTHDPSG